MEKLLLNVDVRTGIGTGAARAIRRLGNIPAVVYGGRVDCGCIAEKKHNTKGNCGDKGKEPRLCGVSSTPISLEERAFTKYYSQGGVQSKIFVLEYKEKEAVDGKSKLAVVREVQCHPVTGCIMHVDLQSIDPNQEIHIAINVHLINKEMCVGVKQKDGAINLVKRTLDVMCAPDNAVSYIEIDVADLDVGDSIHVKDLQLPVGIRAVDKDDVVLLSVSGPVAEEEEVAEVKEVVEGEEEGKAAAEGGGDSKTE
jgi:large subunit ribosomal protein L25